MSVHYVRSVIASAQQYSIYRYVHRYNETPMWRVLSLTLTAENWPMTG